MTKAFEEVVCETAFALSARFGEAPKGEITLVIGPATGIAEAVPAVAAVVELVAAGASRAVAAAVVARLTGVSRNTLYGDSL